jgi:hypothetical protein
MDYRYEERGRRLGVGLAAGLSGAMLLLGLAHGAPWPFLAVVGLSGAMALAIFAQDRRSGLSLEGHRLVLYRGPWRHEIDTRAIRAMRTTAWTDGQPDVWLDLDGAPAYRLPGPCVGSVERLKQAFRARGIPVA